MGILRIEVSSKRVAAADHVGSFRDFDLYLECITTASYSARAMVYVYAKRAETEKITFAQVAAVHRREAEDLSELEVQRLLTIDALTRAKHRIKAGTYREGEAYIIELKNLQVD